MREQDRSKMSAWRQVRSAWAELRGDRDGSALFYTTLSLPVLLGFALLTIDGSRLMNHQSTLQHASDALALAAAGELNHQDNSLERAKLAIQQLVQNDQRFGDAGLSTVECPTDEDCDVTGRFLTSLPPDDATSINDWIAGDPNRLVANLSDDLVEHARSSAARFIEITVKPQGLSTLMPASFVGGSNNVSATATAVAGYTRGVCFFTPMMMCNPFEDSDPDLFEVAATPEFKRRMIQIRKAGGNSDSGCGGVAHTNPPAGPPGGGPPGGGPPGGGGGPPFGGFYTPGNFTFLRTSLGPGAEAVRQSLAMVDPGACYVEDGVDTQPGQLMGPAREGINVRFDIFKSEENQAQVDLWKSDPNYRPSLNVRKGAVTPGNVCAPTLEANASYQGLPCDSGLSDIGGGRIGNGDWDFENYWDVNFNHGDDPIPPPNGWDNTDENRPSRYEVYRHEIETMVPDATTGELVPLYTQASVGGEKGAPMCHTGGGLADEPDRRILHAAVVNCNDEQVPMNGQTNDIPVYAFAKFFLLHPVGDGSDSIDVELVEVVAPPTDYQARDTVQLYR